MGRTCGLQIKAGGKGCWGVMVSMTDMDTGVQLPGKNKGEEGTESGYAGKEPAGKEPAGEGLAGKELARKEPAVKEPAGEGLAGKEPAGKEPARKEPAVKEPAGKEPAGKELAGEEPTGKEPAEKESAACKEEIRISVRGLVEFILRHGDIDNRHHMQPENAMQEGGRIHRMIQRRMGAEYRAEVSLKVSVPAERYLLTVEGRADGVIQGKEGVTIDEIKGTYRDLSRINGPMPLHLAQAKCYAYMYGVGRDLERIRVRLTYCHMPTETLRYFYEEYGFPELEGWFEELVCAYRKWADHAWEWKRTRQDSIAGLAFPYPYREGQKELAAHVYRTIYHGKKLFLEAPTGVGKTVSTVYPAVQAMGKGMGEKLFYLTAKTITRTVAEDTIAVLREKGLRLKSVTLTAKEKVCFMEEVDCNPEYCPYAKGHYDRINDAVFDLITSQESFSREKIEAYALKHTVCPFEMCLDASLYADAVICDYNYLFDPHVYLKRFFGEGAGGNYIFLIDEAHNLLERGREMYSAVLWKEQFLELCREIKKTVASEKGKRTRKADISGQISMETALVMTDVSVETEPGNSDGDAIDQSSTALRQPDIVMEQAGIDPGQSSTTPRQPVLSLLQGGDPVPDIGERAVRRGGRSVLVRQGYAEKLIYQLEKCNQEMLALKRECENCRIVEEIDSFVQHLMRLQSAAEDYLEEQEEGGLPVREEILDFYFEISHFLTIYELVDENYVKYTQLEEDGSFLLKLLCVNPRENLKNCMARGRSAILFSATLLPIQYYKKLLGGDPEDYEVYARSVFSPAKRALLIAADVTSKYTRRSEEEYGNIVRYIEEIVKNRHGNYMVFCPSYAFLRNIYERYVDNYGQDRECIMQSEAMREEDREAFLACFQTGPDPGRDRILIGFCVLGGIFSEGIDLKNDSLIGVVIVGTGLPQVCGEKEILKAYFDRTEGKGFDYAYRYPGMNKVLQAAGRVIRTVEDVGIISLLDERFLAPSYRKLFPREWENYETVTVNTAADRVERFWNEWL